MTEVATKPKGAEVATTKELMAEFAALFNDELPELDPREAQLAIVEQIIAGETLEDIFGGRDTVASKDYLDRPFTLLGTDIRESTIDGDGPGRYMILRCVDTNGESFVMTSGSMNIMSAAWVAGRRGLLPATVQVKRAAKPSAAGFYPLWLELAPQF
jgi:hypothetical protein